MTRSRLTDQHVMALAVSKDRLMPRRHVRATIIHTTGNGPAKRATSPRYSEWRSRWGVTHGDALGAAVALYSRIMLPCGHYVVGPDGTIVNMVDEELAAWHVGGAQANAYWTQSKSHRWANPRSRYAWWLAAWPGMDTPRGLAGGHLWDPYESPVGLKNRITAPGSWARGSCNANTIGIEVAQWTYGSVQSVTKLVMDIHSRHGIPLDKHHVLTHSDAHPLSRTTPSGTPWDPKRTDFSWPIFVRHLQDLGGTSRLDIC